jgi:hypothetical protein
MVILPSRVKRWQPRPCRRGVWCGGRPRSARRQPRLRAAGGRAGRADGRRHEHTDILPYDLVGGIPKEALGSRVERLDDAPLVNGDDPVHRGLQNGVRARLTVAEHRLSLPVHNNEIVMLLVQLPFGNLQRL